MRLQLDRRSVVLFIVRLANIQCLPLQFEVILYQHTVEEDRDIGRSLQRAVCVKSWSGPYYVVGLPLSGLPVRVRQGNALLVDTAGLTVHIRFVIVGIENLQLI